MFIEPIFQIFSRGWGQAGEEHSGATIVVRPDDLSGGLDAVRRPGQHKTQRDFLHLGQRFRSLQGQALLTHIQHEGGHLADIEAQIDQGLHRVPGGTPPIRIQETPRGPQRTDDLLGFERLVEDKVGAGLKRASHGSHGSNHHERHGPAVRRNHVCHAGNLRGPRQIKIQHQCGIVPLHQQFHSVRCGQTHFRLDLNSLESCC